jgi:UDP-GlcNAc:undecaprenyl-phosphate GlcNAc-1-phosphate transferase
MDVILRYKTYIALFLGAGVASYVLVPLVRRIALRLEAFDPPSNRRIRANVPTLGGLGVAIPFFLGLGLLFLWPNFVSERFFDGERPVLAMLLGGAMVLGLGIYDDLRGTGAWTKLPVQVAAALLVCAMAGPVRNVHLPLFGEVALGVASSPLTVLWIVGITNAFNFIDGIDGLAAGVGALVFGVNFFVANLYGHVEMMVVAALMCGGLLAFLRYNYYPARIFLGDTGSMFVGFILAVSALVSSMKAPTTAILLVPCGLLGYPILDTVLAVTRRVLKAKPVFSSDRSHIHHKLLFCGLGHRLSSAVAYGFTLVFAGIVVFSIYGRHHISGLLVALATAGLLFMFSKFGYWEFIRRHFSMAMRRQYRLYNLEAEVTALKMAEARDLDGLWRLLRQMGQDYGLQTVRMAGKDWERRWENPQVEDQPKAETSKFRLKAADAILQVKHKGGKDDDIRLEQNLLLEKISKTLERELLRVQERPSGRVVGRSPGNSAEKAQQPSQQPGG